jgi:FkbM family methyltransferase
MSCFNLLQILQKYNVNPKGIIHIGAHLGEEKSEYNKLKCKNKTLWVEANPELYNDLKKNVGNDIVISEALYNKKIIHNFNITSAIGLPNNKQSSSLKDLDYHIIAHPNVSVSKFIKLEKITITDAVNKYKININNYDFLNIDVQGSELEVLEGFENLLDNIRYIYAEVNEKPLYKDIALIDSLDCFLDNKGFKRVETSIHKEAGWGQGFYIRK